MFLAVFLAVLLGDFDAHCLQHSLNENGLRDRSGERYVVIDNRLRDAPNAIFLSEIGVFLHLYYVGCNVRRFLCNRVGNTAHGWAKLSSGCDEYLYVNILRHLCQSLKSRLTQAGHLCRSRDAGKQQHWKLESRRQTVELGSAVVGVVDDDSRNLIDPQRFCRFRIPIEIYDLKVNFGRERDHFFYQFLGSRA